MKDIAAIVARHQRQKRQLREKEGSTMPTTTAPKVGVNIGVAEVTCPRCGKQHQTSYFSLTWDGVSLCANCAEEVSGTNHRSEIVEALEALDTAMWLAQTDEDRSGHLTAPG